MPAKLSQKVVAERIKDNTNGEYKPVAWFGGDKAFSKQVNHDLLKKKYASEHGYKLLCIKYTYRTQSMINKILSKHIQCNAETHHTKN